MRSDSGSYNVEEYWALDGRGGNHFESSSECSFERRPSAKLQFRPQNHFNRSDDILIERGRCEVDRYSCFEARCKAAWEGGNGHVVAPEVFCHHVDFNFVRGSVDDFHEDDLF